MNRTFFSVSLVAGALLGSGCKGCSNEATDKPADASTATPSATVVASAAPKGSSAMPTVPWQAIPSATAPVLPNMGIAERFQMEQKARPAGIKPNADTAYDALGAAGPIAEKKQHLASPFGARYCVGARLNDAQGKTLAQLSVCEYVSEELAVSAADYSAKSMSIIENRSVTARKQLTLTIRLEAKAPANEAAAAKAIAIFKGL